MGSAGDTQRQNIRAYGMATYNLSVWLSRLPSVRGWEEGKKSKLAIKNGCGAHSCPGAMLKTWRRGFKSLPGRNGNCAAGWVA